MATMKTKSVIPTDVIPILESGPNGWFVIRVRGICISIGTDFDDEYRQIITIGMLPQTINDPRPKVMNFGYNRTSITIDYFLEKPCES